MEFAIKESIMKKKSKDILADDALINEISESFYLTFSKYY